MLSHQERRLLGFALILFLLGLGWVIQARLRTEAAVTHLIDHDPPAELPTAEVEGQKEPVSAPGGDAPSPPPDVVVHVAGAVRTPGVYRLGKGARVIEAIEAAGGADDEAVVDALNLAEPVHDAMRIYVPDGDEAPCPETVMPATAQADPTGELVDINRATVDQMQSLPGIGPVLAARIIAYREQNGPFRSAEDLLGVSGIGPRSLEQLQPHLIIR